MSYKSTPIAFNTPLSYPSNVETARRKPSSNNAQMRNRMISERQSSSQYATPYSQQMDPRQGPRQAESVDVFTLMNQISDKDLLAYIKQRNIPMDDSSMSCASVINHVCSCKLCSGVINPCQTIYIIVIAVLCLTVVYLFNKLIDSTTYK
jgi:hypothetical protein